MKSLSEVNCKKKKPNANFTTSDIKKSAKQYK